MRLKQADGDLDEAVAILRKAGLAAAAKKAGRGAKEGAVAVFSSGHNTGEAVALVEINSETDFVARNELFQELAADVAQSALGVGLAHEQADLSIDVLSATPPVSGSSASITEMIGVAVSQLGENLVLRRASVLSVPKGADGLAPAGVVASYVHNAYSPNVGKTAAAVALHSEAASTDEGKAQLHALGQKLAMHVVAAQPQLDSSSVDAAFVQGERDIEQARPPPPASPPTSSTRWSSGCASAFEVCLLEQPYAIDESAGSVGKVLKAAGKELGHAVTVGGFVRWQVGEGMDEEEEGL